MAPDEDLVQLLIHVPLKTFNDFVKWACKIEPNYAHLKTNRRFASNLDLKNFNIMEKRGRLVKGVGEGHF